jgi:N-acetylmuramoyl-L-alanine amidase
MNKVARGLAVGLLLAFSPSAALAGTYPVLKLGSTGSEVTTLQNELKQEGYFSYNTATGYYGSITKQAVADFQSSKGLSVDGVAGSQTQTALYEVEDYTTRAVLKKGLSGDDVVALQQALKDQGYFFSTATGYYGTITHQAVCNFQAAKGLVVDGIAGPSTQGVVFNRNNSTSSRGTVDRDSLYWLARIVHAESSGEPYEGKLAVANVILNRTESTRFPNTVYDVIFEYYKGIPQFSPVAEGTIYNTPSDESLRAAESAAQGVNNIDQAIFFFNPEKAVGSWITQSCTYVAQIGEHVFYQ